jgi:D-amino-acid dehydrogenase
VEEAAIPLRDIALISQQEYESWASTPGFGFAYEHKGLLELFQTEEKEHHAQHTLEKAHELGLDAVLLNAGELQAMEPNTRIIAKGALYFKCDAHLYPNRLMEVLIRHLTQQGVDLIAGEVQKFETGNGKVKKVVTSGRSYEADEIVIATGTWSREIAALLNTRIPLVGGRGYSVTLENSPYQLNYPSILMEGRVALTPMEGNKMRFGGTMEVTSTSTRPRLKRVQGILQAVKRFYPDFDIPMPSEEKIWYGFRPCSADGLPYIGRTSKFNNVVIATGHSMLGLSLGAGTGKLVDEVVNDKPRSMDMHPFAVERFA